MNAAPEARAGERSAALDALRFLAAAFIVIYHAGDDAPVHLGAMAPIFGRGWLATDFFLMLSGYVLGRAYGAQLDAARIGAVDFFKRRVLRVWPGQAMVLLGFLLLLTTTSMAGVHPRHLDHFTVDEFFEQLGLVHAWGFTHGEGWNQPSWSLSVLVVCYALFAPVWAATRRLTPTVALVAGPVVVALSALAVSAMLGESLYDLRSDAGLPRGVPLFVCGMLLARASAGLRLSNRSAMVFLGSAAGALVVSQLVARSEASAFGAILAIGTIILAADAWKGVSAMAALGARLSFSLYISSSLTGAVWFGLVRLLEARLDVGEAGLWLLWAGFLPAALAAAWLFERYIDAPIQRWIKAARAPRDAPAPATA